MTPLVSELGNVHCEQQQSRQDRNVKIEENTYTTQSRRNIQIAILNFKNSAKSFSYLLSESAESA